MINRIQIQIRYHFSPISLASWEVWKHPTLVVVWKKRHSSIFFLEYKSFRMFTADLEKSMRSLNDQVFWHSNSTSWNVAYTYPCNFTISQIHKYIHCNVLWIKCLYSLTIYMLKPNPQCDGIWSWGLWKWWSHVSGVLINDSH